MCVYGNQAAFTLPDQMMDGHTVSLALIKSRTAALFQPQASQKALICANKEGSVNVVV